MKVNGAPIWALLCVVGIVTACKSSEIPVEIQLAVVVDNQSISCGVEVETEENGTFMIRDLRWYAHEVIIVGADGRKAPFRLTTGGNQANQVSLLDFEDGCHNGTKAMHTSLKGNSAAKKPWTSVQFTVGVPFELNHADFLQAQGPLALQSMHWSWQGGYKFFRLDARVNNENVRYHLGSTGCEGTIGNIESCANPNLGTLTVSLSNLQGEINLTPALPANGTANQGCMSQGGKACEQFFAWLAVSPQK